MTRQEWVQAFDLFDFNHDNMISKEDWLSAHACSSQARATALRRARSRSQSKGPPSGASERRAASDRANAVQQTRSENTKEFDKDTVPAAYRTGQKVFLPGGVSGIVRFVGTTSFAEGPWVGLELDMPVGRNSGTVCGVEYFRCGADRGLFLQAPW